jgi:hypothetical protein
MEKIRTSQKEKKLHSLVRQEVIGIMREIFSDPEIHLELTSGFTKRLKKSINDKKTGKITPLSKVLNK